MQKLNFISMTLNIIKIMKLIVLSIVLATTAYAIKPTQKIPVDDDIWPYFNWAAFDQDKIVSYGNFQYSVYWDADSVLVIVRRNLKDNSIQTLRFPKFKLTVNPKDGHRNTVIGISPNDGRLHFSWDHHCDNLHYTKSRKGFLTNPPTKMSLTDFEPAQPLAPNAPQIVTYPRFFNDSNDELFFVYRTGWSGFGDSIISSYNSKKDKWNIIGCFLGQEGIFKPWKNSTNRNAYLNDVLFDKNNRLHITWLYREEASGYGNNHDLHYAYSDDSGVTWMNNNGEIIADVSKKDPILISDPGIIIEKIPIYSWLINQCAMTIDSKNQPHVAIYKLPTPQKSSTIFPPPNLKEQQCFYHYWRDSNGKWHNSGPLEVPKGLSIGRPNIVVDSNDNIIIYWASNKGLRYYLAKSDDKWKKWSLYKLTDENLTCNDPPKHDRRLLKNKGILSFTVDPKGKKEGRGYAILDFNIKNLVSASKSHDQMMIIEDDAYYSFAQMAKRFNGDIDYSSGPFEKKCAVSSSEELSAELDLKNTVTGKGSMSLWIKPEKLYSGGVNAQLYTQNLIEAENLFKIKFSNLKNFVWINFEWQVSCTANKTLDNAITKNSMHISLPRVPKDEWINLFFVWDCKAGLFNCYINGTPYRDPKARMPGWNIGKSNKLKIYTGEIPLGKITLSKKIPDKKIIADQAGKYKNSLDKFIGAADLGILNIENKKGKLLYENTLNSKKCLDDWIIEGPAKYDFNDGWMVVQSKQPDGNHLTGHIVMWCPEDFSGDFIAEWEVQIVSKYGLCIVFFDAHADNGKSIFDPSLAKRNGVFKRYHSGDINSYHISYYAATPLGVRSMSNLRKNKGFYLVSNGPTGIEYDSKEIHKITLMKKGGYIQLAVNGRKIINFTDDDKTYGPVWNYGKIGLRQMKWTKAKYRNFKVYSIR